MKYRWQLAIILLRRVSVFSDYTHASKIELLFEIHKVFLVLLSNGLKFLAHHFLPFISIITICIVSMYIYTPKYKYIFQYMFIIYFSLS